MIHVKRIAALPAVALALAAGSSAWSADQAALRLRASAVDTENAVRTSTLDIGIERWTTDAEHARLAAVLKEKGDDALLDALQDVKPRAGYIRSTGSVGWDI